jgi:ParB-like nuclease family protein
VSELQPNTSGRDSSLPDDSLLTDLPPPGREGLPAGYRMRAEAHYVDDLSERSVGPVIRMMSTHAIQADHALSRAELEPLIRSIAAHGILQPLLVRGDGPPYSTVAGRNRLEAARLAGLTTVPCVILPIDGAQAEALADADNLRCGVPTAAEPDGRPTSDVDGFRQTLRRHMSTIQTAMTLSMGDDAVTRQVGFDLAHTHSYRAAWMVDAQQLVEHVPVRGNGSVAVASVIDHVRKALTPELRLAGVTLHVTFADGVASESVDERLLGVGLTGAIVALLPVVDLGDRPVIQIRAARLQSSTTVEVSCSNASISKDWARRLFDESWTDRPGGWQARLGAAAVKAAAERLGGEVALVVPPHGGVAMKMRISRPTA